MAEFNRDMVRESKIPPILSENGRTALVIDCAAYRNLSPEDKKIYRDELVRQFESHDADLPGKDTLPGVSMNAGLVDQILAGVMLHQQDDFTGEPRKNFHIIVLDAQGRDDSLFSYYDKSKPLPPGAEAVNGEFSLHHEAAHALYRTGEAGADYMGAVETLIAKPDSRATLQIIADYRMTTAIEKEITALSPFDSHSNATEISSSMAIKHALSLGPEQLAMLSSLPQDERRAAIHDMARSFDNDTVAYEALSPNKDVQDAVATRYNQKFRNSPDYSSEEARRAAAAQDVLKNDCPFPAGTPQHYILESYAETRQRQFVSAYAPNLGDKKELHEWYRDPEKDFGEWGANAHGPMGSSVDVRGEEGPGLKDDVWDPARRADAAAIKGALPALETKEPGMIPAPANLAKFTA